MRRGRRLLVRAGTRFVALEQVGSAGAPQSLPSLAGNGDRIKIRSRDTCRAGVCILIALDIVGRFRTLEEAR
jgi:hypothetical protein